MDDQETLLGLLSKQLADAGVAEEVSRLVLAAYAGDHQLRAVLDGGSFDLGTGAGAPVVRPEIARRADYAWASLSRAGHHQSYELALSATELNSLRAEVQPVVSAFSTT